VIDGRCGSMFHSAHDRSRNSIRLAPQSVGVASPWDIYSPGDFFLRNASSVTKCPVVVTAIVVALWHFAIRAVL
jgi:hypothetical protein